MWVSASPEHKHLLLILDKCLFEDGERHQKSERKAGNRKEKRKKEKGETLSLIHI